MKTGWLLCVSFLLSACGPKNHLVLGWTPVEPSAQISQLLISNLNAVGSCEVTGKQFEDSNALTNALREQEIDLAIIEQPATATKDFAVLAPLYPSVLHVLAKPGMASKDDQAAYLADIITGRSLYAGPPGSAGHTLVNRLIRDGILPSSDKMRFLDSPLGEDPDVYIVFGGILSADALRRLKGFELVGLGSVEEFGKGSWVEGIALRFPNLDPMIIPKGLYQDVGEEATLSLAVQSLLVTNPNLEVDVAYDVTRHVSQNLVELRTIYPLAGTQSGHLVAQNSMSMPALNLLIHPGAMRYLERDAPGYLERYSETLALIITALLALSSLALGLLRLRNQAKKDRIDVYMDKVLAMRDALHSETETPERIAADVRALQATVAGLVVDERIVADSAFVGFLSLSNQLLRETAAT